MGAYFCLKPVVLIGYRYYLADLIMVDLKVQGLGGGFNLDHLVFWYYIQINHVLCRDLKISTGKTVSQSVFPNGKINDHNSIRI